MILFKIILKSNEICRTLVDKQTNVNLKLNLEKLYFMLMGKGFFSLRLIEYIVVSCSVIFEIVNF